MFQIDTTSNTAKLYFSPVADIEKYVISYSTRPLSEEYGAEVVLAREGVQSFTINLLKPNTAYYFKVRPQRGCMPGIWSNVMKVFTTSNKLQKRTFYKNVQVVSSKPSILKSNLILQPKLEVIPTVEPTPKVIELESPKQINVTVPKKCFLWWCR